MLYDIIIAPIEMIVDWVFLFSINYMAVFDVIGAIVCVSMVINFLTLPIYNMAERIQENERNIQVKLSPWVVHIKRAFKGDERFMMLQTYYREENYSPIYALRSSISILIQIPFFMAAYHYLSNNELLKEGGFLFIENLGKPDALFSAGGFAINVLPIFMTFINVMSGIIYTKGFPLREKVQVYGLAAVFLILLYNSPSGLVLYWIMNNIFSLCKNFVKKTKNPIKVAALGVCVLLLAVLVASVIVNPESFGWKKKFLLAFVAVCIVATLFSGKALAILKTKFASWQKSIFGYAPPPYINSPAISKQQDKTNFLLFFSSAIGLALLAGFLLPSSVIATSPIEFSFLGQTESPLSYIYSSACVFAGFFILWPIVIYKMFSGKVRKVMPLLFFVMFVCSLLNAYVFKHEYGTLNTAFILDKPNVLGSGGFFLSFVPFVSVVIVAVVYAVFNRIGTSRFLIGTAFSVCIATAAFGAYNTKYIYVKFASYNKATEAECVERQQKLVTDDIEPIYHLSKTGKNVIILWLDRGINSFFPLVLEQFPELKHKYNGFKFYPNTLTFATSTIVAAPSIYAGYEYSPEKINERNTELLREKHNEAQIVPGIIFKDADFNVMFTDPPFANYSLNKWYDDYAVFDDYGIKAKKIYGTLSSRFIKERGFQVFDSDKICIERIKDFSILQIIVPSFRKQFYELTKNKSQSSDVDALEFIDAFSGLYYLKQLTDFTSEKNTFHFIVNRTTHDPTFLNYPDYDIPVTDYSFDNCGLYEPKDEYDLIHYMANVAAIKQIASWLDYLRENDIYDNSRVIILSDHGTSVNSPAFKHFENYNNLIIHPASANALLVIKDFDSEESLAIDDSFMTVADTILMAKEGFDISDTNPFSGKKFVYDKKNGINLLPVSGTPNPHLFLEKKQFPVNTSDIINVKDNIFEESNWTKIEYRKNKTTGEIK